MAFKPNKKIRLDQLLVDRGLAESRTRAQAMIMSGIIFSGEKRLDKPGYQISADLEIELRGKVHPWVSRGGVKLAHSLKHFDIDPSGQVAIDIGASTGGFTDVLLSQGAAKVYAVDVGYGQLDPKVREDNRVVVCERTNARYLTPKEVPELVDLVVCDASFIGLRTVLPASLKLTKPEATLIALIKPQFEVGKALVGRKGVVRNPKLHTEVCTMICDWLNALKGWLVLGISESPITGPEGNKEFLVVAIRSKD